ncbi:hypothetical protein ACJJTC_019641 [Scirpophaga incertulas]
MHYHVNLTSMRLTLMPVFWDHTNLRNARLHRNILHLHTYVRTMRGYVERTHRLTSQLSAGSRCSARVHAATSPYSSEGLRRAHTQTHQPVERRQPLQRSRARRHVAAAAAALACTPPRRRTAVRGYVERTHRLTSRLSAGSRCSARVHAATSPYSSEGLRRAHTQTHQPVERRQPLQRSRARRHAAAAALACTPPRRRTAVRGYVERTHRLTSQLSAGSRCSARVHAATSPYSSEGAAAAALACTPPRRHTAVRGYVERTHRLTQPVERRQPLQRSRARRHVRRTAVRGYVERTHRLTSQLSAGSRCSARVHAATSPYSSEGLRRAHTQTHQPVERRQPLQRSRARRHAAAAALACTPPRRRTAVRGYVERTHRLTSQLSAGSRCSARVHAATSPYSSEGLRRAHTQTHQPVERRQPLQRSRARRHVAIQQ